MRGPPGALGGLRPSGGPVCEAAGRLGTPQSPLLRPLGEGFLHWCSGSHPLWATHNLQPLDGPHSLSVLAAPVSQNMPSWLPNPTHLLPIYLPFYVTYPSRVVGIHCLKICPPVL